MCRGESGFEFQGFMQMKLSLGEALRLGQGQSKIDVRFRIPRQQPHRGLQCDNGFVVVAVRRRESADNFPSEAAFWEALYHAASELEGRAEIALLHQRLQGAFLLSHGKTLDPPAGPPRLRRP